jgi:hypothetical protein
MLRIMAGKYQFLKTIWVGGKSLLENFKMPLFGGKIITHFILV